MADGRQNTTSIADEWTSVESRYDPIDLSATQVTGVVTPASATCRDSRRTRSGGASRQLPFWGAGDSNEGASWALEER
jgi:hypothetical protein